MSQNFNLFFLCLLAAFMTHTFTLFNIISLSFTYLQTFCALNPLKVLAIILFQSSIICVKKHTDSHSEKATCIKNSRRVHADISLPKNTCMVLD